MIDTHSSPLSSALTFLTSPPYIYLLALLPILLFALRKPLLGLITPRGIPGIPALPDPRPIWGDIHWMAGIIKKTESFSRVFEQLARDLGPIAQLRLGPNTFVVVTDYQEVESILSRHAEFDRASNTTALFRGLLPSAQISQPTNHMWKHHRRIIGPAMTSKYLSLTTPRANEAVGQLIGLIKAKRARAGGRAWAAEHDLESATMDAICGMAFGASWGILQSKQDQVKAFNSIPEGPVGEAVFDTKRPEIAASMWYLFEALPIKTAFPVFQHFYTSRRPTYKRHQRRVYSYLQDKLKASREKAKLMGDAAAELADNTLDMMVAREQKADDWMPDNEMIDEVVQYLVAGTETSGVTLSWWMKFMTNNPDVQRKLRIHLLTRMPELQDRQPTFEDLNATNLPYLEAVVHETLRLSRTAGGYTREAKEDTIVLGCRIPKGTTIVCSTAQGVEDAANPVAGPSPLVPRSASASSIASKASSLSSAASSDNEDGSGNALVRQTEALASRRHEPDAKRKVGYWAANTGKTFDPERWLDERGEIDMAAGPSLPFSMGQRGCFGKNLALLELRLFMSQLNLAFFFAPLPEKQNSMDHYETIATHPVQSFIRPVDWDSPEAKA